MSYPISSTTRLKGAPATVAAARSWLAAAISDSSGQPVLHYGRLLGEHADRHQRLGLVEDHWNTLSVQHDGTDDILTMYGEADGVSPTDLATALSARFTDAEVFLWANCNEEFFEEYSYQAGQEELLTRARTVHEYNIVLWEVRNGMSLTPPVLEIGGVPPDQVAVLQRRGETAAGGFDLGKVVAHFEEMKRNESAANALSPCHQIVEAGGNPYITDGQFLQQLRELDGQSGEQAMPMPRPAASGDSGVSADAHAAPDGQPLEDEFNPYLRPLEAEQWWEERDQAFRDAVAVLEKHFGLVARRPGDTPSEDVVLVTPTGKPVLAVRLRYAKDYSLCAESYPITAEMAAVQDEVAVLVGGGPPDNAGQNGGNEAAALRQLEFAFMAEASTSATPKNRQPVPGR